MKTMLIVFHSLTGGTRQMAEAAARGGAAQAGIQVDLVEASKAGAADVLHADGYIFATPENSGCHGGHDEGLFRSDLLRRARSHRRSAIRDFGLRWKRWAERSSTDRAHRDRLAIAGHRRSDHHLHACADTGSHFCTQVASTPGSQPLRGAGFGARRRPDAGYLLIPRRRRWPGRRALTRRSTGVMSGSTADRKGQRPARDRCQHRRAHRLARVGVRGGLTRRVVMADVVRPPGRSPPARPGPARDRTPVLSRCPSSGKTYR